MIGVSEEWIIIKLGRSLPKTLRSYHQAPEAKTLFCFQTKRSKKLMQRKKKNPRWRTKLWKITDRWPDVLWNEWNVLVKCIWRDHRKLTLKLFIFPVSENIYISFTLHIYIQIYFAYLKKNVVIIKSRFF